jgi:hypothetical protein
MVIVKSLLFRASMRFTGDISAPTGQVVAVRGGFHHLAFTIPSNRFADAAPWPAARVDGMTRGGGEIELRLGEPRGRDIRLRMGRDRT